MGYTHYINDQIHATDEQWESLKLATQHIIATARAEDVILVAPEGTSDIAPPDVNDVEIAFNGFQEEGYESLWLDRVPTDKWSFCKTDRRAYDKYVVAVLFAADIIGILGLTSDGDAEELADGIELAHEALAQQPEYQL